MSASTPSRPGSRRLVRETSFTPATIDAGRRFVASPRAVAPRPQQPPHPASPTSSTSSAAYSDPHSLHPAASPRSPDPAAASTAVLDGSVDPREFERGWGLVDTIRAGIIGDAQVRATPFGYRRTFYADYTSSGRSLGFIEDFILAEVLPVYEAHQTSVQLDRFQQDARDMVRQHLKAGPDDEVSFTGSGASGAIVAAIQILGISSPQVARNRDPPLEIPENSRPVVFISRYEHNANDRLWRDSQADVVVIDEDKNGSLSLANLRTQLEQHQERPLLLGSFSAANNVTGVLLDTVAVALLLHEFGALAFFDYAVAGSHTPIDLNPQNRAGFLIEGGHKDAVFLSPHKFVGGVSTTGVLAIKKTLLAKRSDENEHYDLDQSTATPLQVGTPPVVSIIRCGLVFQLVDQVTMKTIVQLEANYSMKAVDSWSKNKWIRILGPVRHVKRIGVLSVVIEGLHYNFVVALLNDLFGIQARGASCLPGPHTSKLLRLSSSEADTINELYSRGLTLAKPGWVKIDFAYFFSETVVDYMIFAIDFIANHGWKFLSVYDLSIPTGQWTHMSLRTEPREKPRSLHEIDYSTGQLTFSSVHRVDSEDACATYRLEAAILMREIERATEGRITTLDPPPIILPSAYEGLARFLLRQDSIRAIRQKIKDPSEVLDLRKEYPKSKKMGSGTRVPNVDLRPQGKDLVVHSMGLDLRRPAVHRYSLALGDARGSWDMENRWKVLKSNKTFLVDIAAIVQWDRWIPRAMQPVRAKDLLSERGLYRVGYTETSETKIIISDRTSNESLNRVNDVYGLAKKAYFPEVGHLDIVKATELHGVSNVLWLDVRSLAERRLSYIPGSISVADLSMGASTLLKMLGTQRYVICYSTVGVRSGLFCQRLNEALDRLSSSKAGLNLNIRNLRGGLLAWVFCGQGVTNDAASKEEDVSFQVHPFRPELEKLVPGMYRGD